MMYNFLDWRLTPNVITECPNSDGYEVSNLISELETLRNKGFLAFSAIKPPVDIDFELICPIKIHYISIWNSIDSQKSSGYEIYGKNDETDYKLIGKTFPEGSGFTMCNRKLYGKQKPVVPSDFSICFLKGSEYKVFNNTNKIRIKITRTAASVPCIGKIEIWGEVSRLCTDKTRETIDYLMKPKVRTSDKTNEIATETPNDALSQPGTSKIIIDFEIPIDFIDEITCEIMTLPMTLPCGKNVDQLTLEKHEHNEALHGRGPSDPYTSLPFTSELKPRFNQALKNRIDDFLLKNKDRVETMSIPRTVGKRKAEYVDVINCKRTKTNDVTCHGLQSTSAEDLDLAIEDAFVKYNITRYSKINERTVSESDDASGGVCGFCKSEGNLYALNVCNHLICRRCLLNVSNKLDCKCNVCKVTFQKNDVRRFHQSK